MESGLRLEIPDRFISFLNQKNGGAVSLTEFTLDKKRYTVVSKVALAGQCISER